MGFSEDISRVALDDHDWNVAKALDQLIPQSSAAPSKTDNIENTSNHPIASSPPPEPDPLMDSPPNANSQNASASSESSVELIPETDNHSDSSPPV